MTKSVYYYANGKKVSLEEVEGEAAVRYREVNSVRRGLVSPGFGKALQDFDRVEEVPDGRLTVLRSRDKRTVAELKGALSEFDEVTYVTPVFRRPGTDERVLLTSKFVCQFKPDMSRAEIDAMNAKHRVYIEAEETYAPNCFVLRLEDEVADTVLDVANAYQESGRVVFAHPDLIVRRSFRQVEPLFPNQWHLRNTGQSMGTAGADIKAEGAWRVTEGRPEVVVAVIDDGMDMQHPDLTGDGKAVAPIDIRSGRADPSHQSRYEGHGTSVCGVAVAKRQGIGVLGVAPGCRIMPIRLDDDSSIYEARAIAYAADKGAWVINCSWGPMDGDFYDPNDPLHNRVAPLPDDVRAAIDYAATRGRGGRGCVITWAAGNGDEPVSNDGYASYPKVIAVAATSHVDKKARYSDHGPEISVAAPSSDYVGAPPAGSWVGGIWTTDRMGSQGDNEGNPLKGDASGHYTNEFGGTSSAAPTVAGVAALVLSANPTLTAAEVKRILEDTADRVDPQNGHWSPGPDGRLHSPSYGYGRVNAERAVAEAMRRPGAIGGAAPVTTLGVLASTASAAIPDYPAPAVVSPIAVPKEGTITDIACAVDIEHTWIGDLVVTLLAPDGTAVVLHNRRGGNTRTLVKTYDLGTSPVLRTFLGKLLGGTWHLKVQDMAARDTGRIRRWELRYAVPEAGADVLAAESTQSLVIPDDDPAGVTSVLHLSSAGTVDDVRVDVDITHTWVGDISIGLTTPSGRSVSLRERTGGSADNIIESYTPATTPALANLVVAGEPIEGPWTLTIRDREAFDVGKLNRWGISVRRK